MRQVASRIDHALDESILLPELKTQPAPMAGVQELVGIADIGIHVEGLLLVALEPRRVESRCSRLPMETEQRLSPFSLGADHMTSLRTRAVMKVHHLIHLVHVFRVM